MTKNQCEMAKNIVGEFGNKGSVSRIQITKWCEENHLSVPQWFLCGKYSISRGIYSVDKIKKEIEQVVCGGIKNTNKQEVKPNKFSITKRFEMMEEIIGLTLKGHQKSIVIVGRGGTGKTTSVVKTLNDNGYDKGEWGTSNPSEYIHIKGTTSPTELYRTLYENRRGLIIFDDCDSVFKNETTINILKAVLDTSGKREVSWISPYIERMEIPQTFEFFGRIVFISNWRMDQIPQAIQSRAMLLDLDFTDDELIERMEDIGAAILGVTDEILKEIIKWIIEHKNEIKDMSIRTLLKVGSFRKHSPSNWKDLCEFAI